MSEEIKTEIEKTEEVVEKKECKCRCLEKFLVTMFASLLGTLLALCLYSAATRDNVPSPTVVTCPSQHHFDHGRFDRHPGMSKEFKNQKFDKKSGFKGEKMRKHFEERPDFDND